MHKILESFYNKISVVKDYDIVDIKVKRNKYNNKRFIVTYELKNVQYRDRIYNFELTLRIGNVIVCSSRPIELDARETLIQCLHDFKSKNNKAKREIKKHIEEMQKNEIINKYLVE